MANLVRFGVSLEDALLKRFDQLIKEKRYSSRSEAIRDLIREELIKKNWRSGKEAAGAITFIFDHHQSELLNKITSIQHDSHSLIISSQHVHLDHHNCLEIIAVKGKPRDIEGLFNGIKAVKGVKHATLTITGKGGEW